MDDEREAPCEDTRPTLFPPLYSDFGGCSPTELEGSVANAIGGSLPPL